MSFRQPQLGVCVGLFLALLLVVHAQTVQAQNVQASQPQATAAGQQNSPPKEAPIMKHARGTFEVKMNPQKPDNKEAEGANFGRMSSHKQFHGELEGTSLGEMLGATTEIKGSAGYVALERVTGTIDGKTGTFVLQHSGTMTRGALELRVTVVPDSGTGELAGIAGRMDIKIDGAKHFYDFEYTIAEATLKPAK